MTRRVTRILLMLILGIFVFSGIFTACSKSRSDYKTGVYWMEKENNWRQASRCFLRALENDPESWKIHLALIQAMSNGEELPIFEQQIRKTLAIFPDSARSNSIASPGIALLGEDRYNRVSALLEMQHLNTLLGKNRNDLEALSRCIMASCRMKDTVGVKDYFKRALGVNEGQPIADSLLQEMRFFIGSAMVEWLRLEWKVEHSPDDVEARIKQIDAGILLGDSVNTVKKLRNLFRVNDQALRDQSLAVRYGKLVGYDPFGNQEIARGWDGCYSPSGNNLIFVKDMGETSYPDLYFYASPISGGTEKPILKAYQQNLSVLAWPSYSPDGKWIYFYGANDKNWVPGDVGKFHLYRVKPSYNSRPVKLSDADLITVDPFFKPDGTILLVRRDLGSVRSSVEVVQLDPENNQITTISRIGEPVSGATFTNAGDSLIFITDRGIFRRSVDGGRITVDLPWIGMSFPQLSPDGKLLKLVNPAGQIVILDRNTLETYFLGTASTPHVSFGSDGKILTSTYNDQWRRVTEINLQPKSVSIDKFISFVKKDK